MKAIGAFAIAMICSSICAQPGGKDEIPNVPKKIKTGSDNLKKTPKEEARIVSAKVMQMSDERKDEIIANALRAQIELYRQILPQWCAQVPVPILIYVDFSVEDTDLERALKFMRMALFVRDMYQDLPINSETFLTLDPAHPQLEQRERYRVVANAFLEAYRLLRAHEEDLDTDLNLSMADFGRWALHYFEMAGDDEGVTAVEIALAMNDVASRAIRDLELTPPERSHFDRLITSSLGVISKNLAPIVWLAFMSGNLQNAKSMGK